MANAMLKQHEPLRVPAGWNEQSRALIIQLERVLDDIYRHFRKLGKKDLDPELLALLAVYDAAVALLGNTPMGTTATTATGAIAEHEGDISGINTKIGTTVLPTTAQTLTGAIDEHETDISGINTKIGNTALPTTAQTLTGAISEVDGDIGSVASELSALYSLTVAQLKGK